MDQNSNSLNVSPDTTSQANQSSTPLTQQMTQIQNVPFFNNGRQKKEKASKRTKRYSIISLIIGCIVLIGYILPYILFGEENLAVVYMAYNIIYVPIFICGIIVCIILFFLVLNNMVKHKIKFSKFTIMAIVGTVLVFSPLIYIGIRKIVRNNDPYIAKGTVSVGNGCSSFAERLEYGTSGPYDILCGYLEAFYKSGKEPKSIQDITLYINSSEVKNGGTKVTIDGEQPKSQHHYNIVTRHSCDYYEGEDNSYISIWYYNINGGKTEYRCDAVRSSNEINIYDLEQSKEWFENQFDEKINSDEEL